MCPSKASKPGDTILKSFGFSCMLFHVSVIRSENQKRNTGAGRRGNREKIVCKYNLYNGVDETNECELTIEHMHYNSRTLLT